MPPQRLFLRAWPAARIPPPPPPIPPSLSQPQQQQQQLQHNNEAPPAAPSSGNGRVARFSYHHASRGTPDGRGHALEDVDRATEPLVDVVRGFGMMVRARCSAGPTRGTSGVGTTSAFSDPRMSVAPDGAPQPGLVSQGLFFGESSATAALPPIPEPVYPDVLPTRPTHPVVCLHRKSANDRIVCLATLHHACHAPSRHTRQTSYTNNNQ